MTNLEKIHFYLKDLESPAHFITWNYLYMIASCLGRRVHLQSAEFGIFPNIYLFIVGPPAVGKTMPARQLLTLAKDIYEPGGDGKMRKLINITPDCVTLESLYEFIEESGATIKQPDGSIYYHSSVSFMLADEVANLFRQKETTRDLVNFLNAGYECKDFEYKTKKSGHNQLKNMCVNFLGCCTPAWVSSAMTESMVGEGFASRAVFLWGDKARQKTTFIKISKEQKEAAEEVKKYFVRLAKLQGEVTFTDAGYKYFDDWYQSDWQAKRVNKDKKLDYYYSRKKILTFKLAMLCHFAERTTMVLDEFDVKNALELAEAAEVNMHKALAVSGRNPLAQLADRVYKEIAIHKTRSFAQILAVCFDGGNTEELREALDYLVQTKKVKIMGTGWQLIEGAEGESSGGSEYPADVYPQEERLPRFLPESA